MELTKMELIEIQQVGQPLEPVRQKQETALAVKDPTKIDAWYKIYDKEKCVSINCQHVHLIGIRGSDRVKAATVSIVNVRSEEVYKASIYHKPGSFLTPKQFKDVTGFNEYSFVNGRPAKDVKDEVQAFMKDKFIIHFGGAADFKSLGLDIENFPTNFDLANHFKKPTSTTNKKGGIIYQTVNLQSVYYFLFGEKMQEDVLSARLNAEAAMKIFIKKYKATKNNKMSSVSDENDWKQFKNIVNIKKT